MMHCMGSGIHAFFLHRIRTQCNGTRAPAGKDFDERNRLRTWKT